MLKNLVPHGNSAALIIDKPILEILKVLHLTRLSSERNTKSVAWGTKYYSAV